MPRLLRLLICLLPINSILANDLKIAVASNFENTLKMLLSEISSEVKIELTSASSSKLTSQIIAGREFDIFFSADTKNIEMLKNKYAFEQKIYNYANGKLLFVGTENCHKKNIKKILLSHRVAIANDKVAPYGKAALSFIKSLHLVKEDLLYASNVKQAGVWLKSNTVKYGIISASMQEDFKNNSCLINVEDYPPIVQSSIILKNTNKQLLARKVLEYILASRGRLKKYGYY